MGLNTRWDVSETKRQLYNRSAWNTIDVGASAKQTTTTQSRIDGSLKIGGNAKFRSKKSNKVNQKILRYK